MKIENFHIMNLLYEDYTNISSYSVLTSIKHNCIKPYNIEKNDKKLSLNAYIIQFKRSNPRFQILCYYIIFKTSHARYISLLGLKYLKNIFENVFNCIVSETSY